MRCSVGERWREADTYTNTLSPNPFLAKISLTSEIRIPASTSTNPLSESSWSKDEFENKLISINITKGNID